MQPALDLQTAPRFDGSDLVADDHWRLRKQLVAILSLMMDGQWRTVAAISEKTGAPEPSVSAQLRNLRKARFGAWTVEKRRRGEPSRGLWEFKVSR